MAKHVNTSAYQAVSKADLVFIVRTTTVKVKALETIRRSIEVKAVSYERFN